MGYCQVVCQLCGVPFNVGRIRTANEPIEAAWNYDRDIVVEEEEADCDAVGCSSITREAPAHIYHDGSIREAQEICEHLAGPQCNSSQGCSGSRISVEDMAGCSSMICIMAKTGDWRPEPEDEAFVLESKDTWMSGISKGPPSELEIDGLEPPLHGVSKALINNGTDTDDEWGIPIHPACFEIFKSISLDTFGVLNIDGIRRLWSEEGGEGAEIQGHGSSDLFLVNDQWYTNHRGTEYLVANPVEIPRLQELITNCLVDGKQRVDTVFAVDKSKAPSADPFRALPPELKMVLMLQLQRQDVAHLRFASRAFRQLPQAYFQELVRSEMPWVRWEVESIAPKNMDWHKLWCTLSAADGGTGHDELERTWLFQARFPCRYWNELIAGLASEDKEQFEGIENLPIDIKGGRAVPDHALQKMRAIADARRAGGAQEPKVEQIHGLRNRRRIVMRIKEIVRRIQDLEE